MLRVFEKLISNFVDVGTGNISLNFKLDILEIKLRARGGVLKKYVEFFFFFQDFFLMFLLVRFFLQACVPRPIGAKTNRFKTCYYV